MSQTNSTNMSGNPVFPGWFADPELHCFSGRYFIYPTGSSSPDRQASFECWSSDESTGSSSTRTARSLR
jgi:hypothetical protein